MKNRISRQSYRSFFYRYISRCTGRRTKVSKSWYIRFKNDFHDELLLLDVVCKRVVDDKRKEAEGCWCLLLSRDHRLHFLRLLRCVSRSCFGPSRCYPLRIHFLHRLNSQQRGERRVQQLLLFLLRWEVHRHSSSSRERSEQRLPVGRSMLYWSETHRSNLQRERIQKRKPW